MNTILKTDHLSREFTIAGEKIIALQKFTTVFKENSYTAIMGKSGSGKTTLLQLLGILDKPSSGEMWLDDIPYSSIKAKDYPIIWNSKIGFIFQHSNLINHFSASKNIEIPLIFRNVPREERKRKITKLADTLEITDQLNQRINQLSGGQKQRVCIARELIKAPRILLADEPTGNLDINTGEILINLFKNIMNENDVTLIVATHDERFEKEADHLLYLEEGNLIQK